VLGIIGQDYYTTTHGGGENDDDDGARFSVLLRRNVMWNHLRRNSISQQLSTLCTPAPHLFRILALLV
jgi:hypothetical protein